MLLTSPVSQDDGLSDLARKFNLTLEAIALQTRHIVDSMNAAGHDITAIYMSGGQAKNLMLMQLFANTCNMPVVLPQSSGAAVVLGAAMLGRFAADIGREGKLNEVQQGEALWKIMVGCGVHTSCARVLLSQAQVEMTPPGTLIAPSASPSEKKLLEAKYKIFRESIDIQYRWRKEIAEASQ